MLEPLAPRYGSAEKGLVGWGKQVGGVPVGFIPYLRFALPGPR